MPKKKAWGFRIEKEPKNIKGMGKPIQKGYVNILRKRTQ